MAVTAEAERARRAHVHPRVLTVGHLWMEECWNKLHFSAAVARANKMAQAAQSKRHARLMHDRLSHNYVAQGAATQPLDI